MKRIVMLLALMFVIAPAAVRADNITFGFGNGILAQSGAALTTSASGGASANLQTVAIFGGNVSGANLGSVSLTTGNVILGSFSRTALLNPGGNLTIVSGGSSGLPAGTIFSGAFSGYSMWSLLPSKVGGTTYYTWVLQGPVAGTIYWPGDTPFQTAGAITTITGTYSSAFSGSVNVAGGYIGLATPEPAGILLFGSGMLGMAGALKLRMFKNGRSRSKSA